MEAIGRGLCPGVDSNGLKKKKKKKIYPYLLIASSSVKEHQRNVEEVFERLKDYGPVINISKSLFGGEEIGFT